MSVDAGSSIVSFLRLISRSLVILEGMIQLLPNDSNPMKMEALCVVKKDTFLSKEYSIWKRKTYKRRMV